jgi:hypothetical protein
LTEAAGPWNTGLHYDEDGEYFARVLLASKGIRFVPGTGIFYRVTAWNRISYVGNSDKKKTRLVTDATRADFPCKSTPFCSRPSGQLAECANARVHNDLHSLAFRTDDQSDWRDAGQAAFYFADIQLPEPKGGGTLWEAIGFRPRAPFHLINDASPWVLFKNQRTMLQSSVISRQGVGDRWGSG